MKNDINRVIKIIQRPKNRGDVARRVVAISEEIADRVMAVSIYSIRGLT